MDTIFIRELRLSAWVGVHRHERAAPQTIELNIELEVPGQALFTTGRVSDTIDYAAVTARVKSMLAEERFGLVETLADRVARLIVQEFKTPRVRVRITKFGAVPEARGVGACVERTATG
ncbi:MAG: dihydroneopterin aldolase [Burkholderiales bacterium]|nr:dihydroneopterin aldolase [Burkholderiales bacterium]